MRYIKWLLFLQVYSFPLVHLLAQDSPSPLGAFDQWSDYEYFHVTYLPNTSTTSAQEMSDYMTFDAWGHVGATKYFIARQVGTSKVLPSNFSDWPEDAISHRHRVLSIQITCDGDYYKTPASSFLRGTTAVVWIYSNLTHIVKKQKSQDYDGFIAMEIGYYETKHGLKSDHDKIQRKWSEAHRDKDFEYIEDLTQLDFESQMVEELQDLNYQNTRYPSPRLLNMSVDSMKAIISQTKTDCIYGIYRLSPGSEASCGKYRFGVFNQDGEDVAVLTQDYNSQGASWKVGEVKATFIPTASPSVYIVDWLMGNKRAVEGYAECEGGLLTINIPEEEDYQCSYVKTFPLNRLRGEQANSRITTSTDTTTPESAASAVVIDAQNRFIVTNYHVVEDGKTFRVEQGGGRFEAVVLKTDPDNDLALLRVVDGGMRLSALAISMDDKLGDRVYSAGYPRVWEMGTEIKVTEGVISSMSFLSDPSRFQTSVPITNGNSGGALLDQSGNLVGITQGGWRPDQTTENVNAAVKSLYVVSLAQTESTCIPTLQQRSGEVDFSRIEESVLPLFVFE